MPDLLLNVLSTNERFIVEVFREGREDEAPRWQPALVHPVHPTLRSAELRKGDADPSLTYRIVKETTVREVVS